MFFTDFFVELKCLTWSKCHRGDSYMNVCLLVSDSREKIRRVFELY